MSMKVVDKENATKANATRGNVYTIHVPTKSTTISIRTKQIDKYANTQTTMCTQYRENTVHKQ